MVAALALALLAPALGGGTSVMASAVLVAGIGLAALFLPARDLRAGFLVGAALVLVMALDWVLPARLSPAPWRAELDVVGLPVGWAASPQPWESLRAWLLLLSGLVWAGWCAGQAWTSRDRRGICEGLALGIGAMALVALATRNTPFWPPGTGLGPFENRNQTAALFAMGGFLTVACGAERFRENRTTRSFIWLMAWGFAWVCVLGIYTAALAVNRSRAGPLLFAGMTLAWALTATPLRNRKPETLLAGLAVALLMGTVFLLTGRNVITRLAGTAMTDFRLRIFSDTLSMIRASPWTGVGLGSFSAIFPLYRNASILQERVLHPENDWLWLAAEAGLPALLAMAGLAVWMGAGVRRALAQGGGRPMRLAASIACAGMLAQSFVDVPGHRLGTVMPALLLLGLAFETGAGAKRWAGWALRAGGLAALLFGAGCLAVLALGMPEPLADGEQVLMARAIQADAAGRHIEAEADIGRALACAPLNWQLYVAKGEIEGTHGELTAALGDFRKACFLEPNYAGLPFDEGAFWLRVAPRFTIAAWQEALRRMPADRRPELYQDMLAGAFAGHPDLRPDLWAMASSDCSMQMIYLGWATPGEFQADLDEVLRDDPELSHFDTGQLPALFELWLEKGDAQRLAFLLTRRPEWLRTGYRAMAEYDAGKGNFADAADLMTQFLPIPPMPPPQAIDHAEAARRFALNPGDIAAGMALYDEASAAGREQDALDALGEMSAAANCPAYVHYLDGRLLVREQKPEEAWKAFEQCPAPGGQ